MMKKVILCTVVLVCLIIPLSACDRCYEVEENMNNFDLRFYDIDLRVFDEESNKFVIDVFLERIPRYLGVCRLIDFVLRDAYADFVVANIDIISGNEMSVYFRLKSNEDEKDFDAVVSIYFHESQLESREVARRLPQRIAAPIPAVFASQSNIGDFAMGDATFYQFIRGNVSISVMRWRMGDTDIDITDLAREIDQQILEIITCRNRR